MVIDSLSRGPVVAIIQARMTSTRLPGKVLMDIAGKPALQRMLERVLRAKELDAICVATTVNETDNPVIALCDELNVSSYRGDEQDVLGRFVGAAEEAGAKGVVRLTADCPMIDPMVLDEVVAAYRAGGWDYVSNTVERTYPDGLDVEVMSLAALQEANERANHPFLREHVTPYISGKRPDLGAGNFNSYQVVNAADFAHVRWTLDRPDDLERIRRLVSKLPEDFHWQQALSLATKEPELLGLS